MEEEYENLKKNVWTDLIAKDNTPLFTRDVSSSKRWLILCCISRQTILTFHKTDCYKIGQITYSRTLGWTTYRSDKLHVP